MILKIQPAHGLQFYRFFSGSLLDVIKFIQSKRDITMGVFDEGTIATILRDVLRGLAYIHENGLVHRYVLLSLV